MEEPKLYLCFEAKNATAQSVYLVYSTKVSGLKGNAPNFRADFTFEKSIPGVSAMGCGLFDSKIILAGGVSDAGDKTKYNRGLITYDTFTKKVAREDIPNMRGRKIRPLVFELSERLYVLDTSNSVHKRTWEVYYPTKKIWSKLGDPFCTMYNKLSRIKNISPGRTPYSWFVTGNTVSLSLPRVGHTYFHHARQISKLLSACSPDPLPFHGMATTYWKPGFSDVVVISFCQGMVGGHGRVEGRVLNFFPTILFKAQPIFMTDPYEKPDGEVSSYFADCGNGKFCLTTFDNVNMHVYVFKILRHENMDGTTSLVRKDLDKHKYNLNEFSFGGATALSVSGCFVLPRDATKLSEESKLYSDVFLFMKSVEEDDDLPPLIHADGKWKIDPDYDSGGEDSDFEVCQGTQLGG